MSSIFSEVFLRIDIKIGISISIRPMTTKFEAGTSRRDDSNGTSEAGVPDVTSQDHVTN